MTAVRIEDNPIPIFPSGSWLTKKFIAATLISTTDADHNALEIAVKANAGASKMTTDRKASVAKTCPNVAVVTSSANLNLSMIRTANNEADRKSVV